MNFLPQIYHRIAQTAGKTSEHAAACAGGRDSDTGCGHGVAFSADGRRILSASCDRTMRLWDLVTGKELHRFKHPEAVFSAPTQDESDVALNTTVRIQFSRDLDPATIKGHVRVSYLDAQTRERGEFVTPSAEFTTAYNAANRVLEIRFAKPLERFRTLKVELLEGILGVDQQPLKPWTLTFGLGGS